MNSRTSSWSDVSPPPRTSIPHRSPRAALDRLAQAKARPQLIERSIRGALRDAIAWRVGGGAAPHADAFSAAAVVAAREALDSVGADSAERSRTLSAVQTAALRFIHSALGRRLMNVAPGQFVRLAARPDGADAIVRDRRWRLHAIVVRNERDAFGAGRTATAIAATLPLAGADGLRPLTVHVFALPSGRRFCFERDVGRLAVGRCASDTRVA